MSSYERSLEAADLVEADRVLEEIAERVREAASYVMGGVDFSEVEPASWRVLAVVALKRYAELNE